MKLTIIFLLFFLLISTKAYTQDFEISPFAGYQFAGSISTDKGKLNIKNDFNYGVFFDIPFENVLKVEFWYSRLTTELFLEPNPGEPSEKLFDMNVEYFHAGGIYMESLGRFRPFAAITVGATRFDPLDEEYEEDWRFSIAVGGGGKYLLTRNIGLRFDWRVLLPIFASNTSIYCTNGGCIFHIEGGTTVFQAHLTGGIIILL
jgi:hypothetical protein